MIASSFAESRDRAGDAVPRRDDAVVARCGRHKNTIYQNGKSPGGTLFVIN